MWPMATKKPSVSSSWTSPVSTFFTRTPVMPPSAPMLSGRVEHLLDHGVPHELDLGVLHGAVDHHLRRAQAVAAVDHAHALREAREECRLLHRGVNASTTMTSLSWKKAPSQVAHADTPYPISSRSPGISRSFATAPVAMMSDSASKRGSFSTSIRRGASSGPPGTKLEDLGAESLGLAPKLP